MTMSVVPIGKEFSHCDILATMRYGCRTLLQRD